MSESGVSLFRLGSRGCSTPFSPSPGSRDGKQCSAQAAHDVHASRAPATRRSRSAAWSEILRSAPRPHAAPRTGRGVSPENRASNKLPPRPPPEDTAQMPAPRHRPWGHHHRCFSFPSSSSDPLCCQQMRSLCFLIGNGVIRRGLISSNAVVDEEHR